MIQSEWIGDDGYSDGLESDDKVAYIVTVTYTKQVRVLAKDEDEAKDLAMDELDGDVEEMEARVL